MVEKKSVVATYNSQKVRKNVVKRMQIRIRHKEIVYSG